MFIFSSKCRLRIGCSSNYNMIKLSLSWTIFHHTSFSLSPKAFFSFPTSDSAFCSIFSLFPSSFWTSSPNLCESWSCRSTSFNLRSNLLAWKSSREINWWLPLSCLQVLILHEVKIKIHLQPLFMLPKLWQLFSLCLISRVFVLAHAERVCLCVSKDKTTCAPTIYS